jgi:peroxiredoxin
MKWLERLFGGRKDMAALGEGAKAPDFSLPVLDGSKFSLQDALKHGQVLAVFFKVSCPVCQYLFPFFERLHKAYGSQSVAMVAVSQDDKKKHGRIFERVRRDLSRAARRSRSLRGFQCIRPD